MSSSARIDELRKKFDENPRRYFAPLANEYRKAGDPDQAIFICQEYLPQQPGHMSGHIVFGQALYETKRLDEARAVFETALTLDPENLIALRHLGDIARDTGDAPGARGWYSRVLEADPRNEEILSLMAALDAAPAGTTPGAGQETSEPGTVDLNVEPTAGAPTPVAPRPAVSSTAPTVEIPKLRMPTPAEPAAAFPEIEQSSTSAELVGGGTSEPEAAMPELESSFDMPALETSEPAPSPEPAPHGDVLAAKVEPPKADDSDLLDLDAMDIGGMPAAAPPPSPPQAAAPSSEMLDIGDFPSSAPTPAEAPASLAGLEGHSPEGSDAAFDDLGTIEGFEATDMTPAMGTVAVPPEPPTEPEPEPDVAEPEPAAESFPEFDLPASPAAEVESVAPDAAVEPAQSESAAAPFVTETMAILYLQQGHRERAVEIYQELIARRPDDAELRARLDAILAPADAEVESPPAVDSAMPEEIVDEGPTIREYLQSLFFASAAPAAPAASEPGYEDTAAFADEPIAPEVMEAEPEDASVAEAPVESDDTWAEQPAETPEPWSEPPAADDWSDVTPSPPPVTATPPMVPAQQPEEQRTWEGDRPTPAGAIDALFAGRGSSDQDQAAAAVLADAFPADEGEKLTLRGRPAIRASGELSLDSVFRVEGGQKKQTTGAFAFEQFFASGAQQGGGAAVPAEAAAEAPPPAEDVEQFNAWLEGLKKS